MPTAKGGPKSFPFAAVDLLRLTLFVAEHACRCRVPEDELRLHLRLRVRFDGISHLLSAIGRIDSRRCLVLEVHFEQR